jgi:hypothetical protein
MKTTHTITTRSNLGPCAIAGVSLALALAFAGCGKAPEASETALQQQTVSLINTVFVDSAPQGALSVHEAREQIEPGAVLTVEGRVAGSTEPFSEYYATLLLADDSLETCDRRPSDSCSTPWDACCVPQETIAKARISVQVVGTDGRPISETLKGVRGLAELDTLIVTGTVAEGSTRENVILNASAIYRAGS